MTGKSPGKNPGTARVMAAVAALGALFVAGYYLDAPQYLHHVLVWVDGLGVCGALVFIGLYIAVCVFVIPGSILTLGAGAVFGVLRGTLYTAVGATLGASVAFLLGRTLFRDWVAQKVAGSRKLSAVDEAVGREGGRLVFLLRLSPLVPFSLSNYVYGLTPIKLRDYVIASATGMLPGILLYSYLGSLVRRFAELGAGAAQTSPAEWGLYTMGLIATIIATTRVTLVARRALKSREIAADGVQSSDGTSRS